MKNKDKSWVEKARTRLSIFLKSPKNQSVSDFSIEKSGDELFRDRISELHNDHKLAVENGQLALTEDETLTGKIPAYIIGLSQHYENYGRLHARSGARDYNIEVTATTNATLITEYIQSAVNGRIAGLNFQIEAKEQKKSILKEEVDLRKRHWATLLGYSNDNENQFSLQRGWMYVVFGVLLLLADIPVSLSVASAYGLVKKIKVSDDFFVKLQNTEALIFSFGIALSAVIVKILYDEYINTKLGRWILELRDFTEEEKPAVRQERMIKLMVKLVILFFFLTMFFYAGIFRNAKLVENASTNARLVSFTLLTVLIPTISGICLSIGFNNFSNVKALRKGSTNLETAQRNYDNVCDEQAKFVVKKSQLEGSGLEWNNTSHKIATIAEQFASSYNQGYKNSYLNFHGYDLYKQVEEFHRELLNRIFRKNLTSEKL